MPCRLHGGLLLTPVQKETQTLLWSVHAGLCRRAELATKVHTIHTSFPVFSSGEEKR